MRNITFKQVIYVCVGTRENWHTDFEYDTLKFDVIYSTVSHKHLYE